MRWNRAGEHRRRKIALVFGAPAMTLIDDDQVEKFFRIFFIEPWTVLVYVAVLDFAASIAKRGEHLVYSLRQGIEDAFLALSNR